MDRFSRFIAWLNISNNNKARTSYDCFKQAIQQHGALIKMRGDKGSENKMIAKHMTLLWQNNIGGYIGGKSTRNALIDCFWHEHNNNVMQKFRSEFEELEELNLLDCTLNSDLWALHYVCMDVI